MATTREDIQRWLEAGKEEGATHLIVVCDTWDYDDYPVFVSPKENVHEKMAEYNGKDMQKIMEVYKIDMDWDTQLGEFRSFNQQ